MGGGIRFSGPVKPHTAVRHAFGTRAVSSVSGSGQEGGAAGVGGAPPPKRSTLCQVSPRCFAPYLHVVRASHPLLFPSLSLPPHGMQFSALSVVPGAV